MLAGPYQSYFKNYVLTYFDILRHNLLKRTSKRWVMSVVCEHFVTHHCQDLTGVRFLEACPHHLPHPQTRRTQPSSYGDWGRMWWGKDAAQIKNIPQKSNKNDSHRLAGDLNNPPLKAIRHHLTSHRTQPITLLSSHTIKYHPIVSQLFCLLLHWPLVWKHLAKGYPLCSLCFWRLTPYTSSGSEHVSTTSVQLWLSDSVWAPHHVTMSWNEALRQLSCRGAGPLEPTDRVGAPRSWITAGCFL